MNHLKESWREWVIPAVVVGGVLWNALLLPQQIYADLSTRYASKVKVDSMCEDISEIKGQVNVIYEHLMNR